MAVPSGGPPTLASAPILRYWFRRMIRAPHPMRPLAAAALCAALSSLGCAAHTAVPPLEPTVARYAQAVDKGDTAALYGMLSSESKRALSKEELGRILGEQKEELRQHAKE